MIDIIKNVQIGTPQCITRVYEYLEKHGSVPFIIKQDAAYPDLVLSSNVIIQKETFDPETNGFKIEYHIKKFPGAILSLRGQITVVLSRAFDGGVEIQAAARGHPSVTLGGSMFEKSELSEHRIVQIWIGMSDVDSVDEDFRLEIRPTNTGLCILNGNEAE